MIERIAMLFTGITVLLTACTSSPSMEKCVDTTVIDQYIEELMTKYDLTFDEIAYIGDDLPDICILEKVKLAACPHDAVDEVKQTANWISAYNGGRGAVREFCDYILKNN